MRYVVGYTLLAIVGLGLVIATGCGSRPPAIPAITGDQTMIEVHVFNKAGKLVGPLATTKLTLTDSQWRERLTPEQFQVLRASGTERAFCGNLLDNKLEGVYACAGCGLPLFASDSKFNSGTGWPSFFQPIAKGNVAEIVDSSHGMMRTEINCGRCDGHLGHVFDDGPRPTGLRFCLNSAALNFTADDQLAKLADPLADAPAAKQTAVKHTAAKVPFTGPTAKVVVAGGCFWCTEAAFEPLDGVLDVESGYTGGSKDTANYEAVCSGSTGHAEAIRITYDPARITLDKLLDVFFDAHDPTQLNRQGADRGTQYRSAIFFANDPERQTAEAKISQLNAAKAFDDPIVTTLEPLGDFYPAETYHQDYARLNPLQPYIQAISTPKVCKIREKHKSLLKKEE